MSNNKAIQILRGANNLNPSTQGNNVSNTTLLDGQPFYSKCNGKLYVGNGDDNISDLKGTEIGLDFTTYKDDGSISPRDGTTIKTNKNLESNKNIIANRFRGDIGDSYITWGDKPGLNDAVLGVTDTALNSILSADRFAYMINDSNIDGGAIQIERAAYEYDSKANTFTISDIKSASDVTNDDKKRLFSLSEWPGTNIGVRLGDGTNQPNEKCLIITLKFTELIELYAVIKRFHINLTSQGSQNCWCRVECKRYNAETEKEDPWENIIENSILYIDDQKGGILKLDLPGVHITGWPGYSSINICPLRQDGTRGDIILIDKAASKSGRVGQLRFIFGCTSQAGGFNEDDGKGLAIRKIQAFGPHSYNTPSGLANNNHIYKVDLNQNVTFPKNLNAHEINCNTLKASTGILTNQIDSSSDDNTIDIGSNDDIINIGKKITVNNVEYPHQITIGQEETKIANPLYCVSGACIGQNSGNLTDNQKLKVKGDSYFEGNIEINNGSIKSVAGKYVEDTSATGNEVNFTRCGLDMNNSDIVGCNAFYFKDLCNTPMKGLQFIGDDTMGTVDSDGNSKVPTKIHSIWVDGAGNFKFYPNRVPGPKVQTGTDPDKDNDSANIVFKVTPDGTAITNTLKASSGACIGQGVDDLETGQSLKVKGNSQFDGNVVIKSSSLSVTANITLTKDSNNTILTIFAQN